MSQSCKINHVQNVMEIRPGAVAGHTRHNCTYKWHAYSEGFVSYILSSYYSILSNNHVAIILKPAARKMTGLTLVSLYQMMTKITSLFKMFEAWFFSIDTILAVILITTEEIDTRENIFSFPQPAARNPHISKFLRKINT